MATDLRIHKKVDVILLAALSGSWKFMAALREREKPPAKVHTHTNKLKFTQHKSCVFGEAVANVATVLHESCD